MASDVSGVWGISGVSCIPWSWLFASRLACCGASAVSLSRRVSSETEQPVAKTVRTKDVYKRQVQRLAHQFRKGMYHHLAHLLPGQPLGQVRALQRCREYPRLTGLLQLRQRPIIRLQSHRGQCQGRQQRQAEGQEMCIRDRP